MTRIGMPEIGLIATATFLLSAVLTGVVRKLAQSHGVIDLPNARSSHVAPTPRGGGAAIVVSTMAGLVTVMWMGSLQFELFMALAGGGVAVAFIGFLDDRRARSAQLRLAVHFAAAVWALVWLGGLPPLQWGERLFEFGRAGYVLGAVGIVWVLNLFNFMDGIDGIAASEAVFISWAAALLASFGGISEGSVAATVFGAACLGFLLWNLPPARIFMGDVGSGFLGYFIAVVAVAVARENPAGMLIWLILGGVFFADATVTFVRRLLRRERIYEAHRSHAYQWLARRWRSHGRVTLLVAAVNLMWVLPCAFVATRYRQHAGWMLITALVPLVFGTLAAGAGQREKS